MTAVNALHASGFCGLSAQEPSSGQVLDIDAIRMRLPHRDPFLFVASAAIHGDDVIHGRAHWPRTHPIIAGHFPNMGIVPGVCQLEAMAQLAGVLIGETNDHNSELVGVLGAVRKALFKAPLWPDQDLQMICRLRRLGDAGYLVNGEGSSTGGLVVTAEFILALRSRDAFVQSSRI